MKPDHSDKPDVEPPFRLIVACNCKPQFTWSQQHHEAQTTWSKGAQPRVHKSKIPDNYMHRLGPEVPPDVQAQAVRDSLHLAPDVAPHPLIKVFHLDSPETAATRNSATSVPESVKLGDGADEEDNDLARPNSDAVHARLGTKTQRDRCTQSTATAQATQAPRVLDAAASMSTTELSSAITDRANQCSDVQHNPQVSSCDGRHGKYRSIYERSPDGVYQWSSDESE